MPSYIPTFSSTVTAVGANNLDLDADSFAFVGTGIRLGSTSGAAIAGDNNDVVQIEGEIVGGNGISLGGIASVTVAETGRVWAADFGMIVGTDSVIYNDGHIYGGLFGIVLNSAKDVHNTGTIIAGTTPQTGLSHAPTAILIKGASNVSVSIDNSGTILTEKAGTFAIAGMGQSADTVVNTGKIVGIVGLGDGNDSFDTHAGHVTGTIDMGAGQDSVKGSAGADVILGGEGDDSLAGNGGKDAITGGHGVDRMSGGTSGDTFYFTTVADSGTTAATEDRILDFKHSEYDHIDLHMIDAEAGTASNDGFTWIGDDSFGHHQGELHYKVTGDNAYVSGDVNGDGTGDFTIRLDHVTTLVKGDFVL